MIPDWIETRSIHKGCLKDKPPETSKASLVHRLASLFKSCLPKVVIAKNNIGLVSITGSLDKILSHRLGVLKRGNEPTQVWQTIAEFGEYQD
jgi:hypothetical protein